MCCAYVRHGSVAYSIESTQTCAQTLSEGMESWMVTYSPSHLCLQQGRKIVGCRVGALENQENDRSPVSSHCRGRYDENRARVGENENGIIVQAQRTL